MLIQNTLDEPSGNADQDKKTLVYKTCNIFSHSLWNGKCVCEGFQLKGNSINQKSAIFIENLKYR